MQPHFLDSIFSIQKFSAAEREQIVSKYKLAEYPKNGYLLKAGQTATEYWFIESGYVRTYVIDTEGREICTNFYASGDVAIDWPSFFLRTPTREYIQAMTDCVCWKLDFDMFQQLFHSIESFREEGRTRLVKSYFTLKSHGISIIADPAIDRYKQLLAQKPDILQNVPLKYIATYLGITDTSLSRIRKEVAQQ